MEKQPELWKEGSEKPLTPEERKAMFNRVREVIDKAAAGEALTTEEIPQHASGKTEGAKVMPFSRGKESLKAPGSQADKTKELSWMAAFERKQEEQEERRNTQAEKLSGNKPE